MKTYRIITTADDFDDIDMEAELERIAKQGMKAYDEDGIRLEETWYILDEWQADREVYINGEWYTREGFIEATLIYKEI